MATLSNNDIAQAIYMASKDKKREELPIFYKEITQFLFRKRLLPKAKNILEKLEKIINKEEEKIIVQITSKEKITENRKREIIELLKKKYKVKEVVLEEKLDEKLLGGLRLEMSDEVIDLSIRNKIDKLQENLIRKI